MDELEEIKSKIDIVDFIGEYLPLKKAGRNFKALCPFHTEKVPSFMVSPERQIWHCFGCGEGGDIFSFLMKMEGLEFREALRILAQRAGVRLKPSSASLSSKKQEFYRLNKLAALFYHKILLESPLGKPALGYLKKRRIEPTTIKEFFLGFAPERKDLLTQFLIKKGIEKKIIIEGGLGIVKEGVVGDLFRNRLIFPLRNLHGDIVGFTARAFSENQMSKYLNTPQTLIFDKSKVLYDLYLAKEAIRQKNFVILVEGQMDVLAVSQTGSKNVVCSSGTALTLSQIDLIKRFTREVVLAFDRDRAGEKATKRSIDLLRQQGLEVKLLIIPYGKDPDECIRQNPRAWQKALARPIPVMDFYFQTTLPKIKNPYNQLTQEEKDLIRQELLREIKKIPDKIEQGFYIQKLADFLKIDEHFIAEALKGVTESPFGGGEVTAPKEKVVSAPDFVELLILGIILKFPSQSKHIILKQELSKDDFRNPRIRAIYRRLERFIALKDESDWKDLKKGLEEPLTREWEESLLAVDFYYESLQEKDILQELENLIRRLKRKRFKEEKEKIQREIRKAERVGDKERRAELMQQLKKIIDQERKII